MLVGFAVVAEGFFVVFDEGPVVIADALAGGYILVSVKSTT